MGVGMWYTAHSMQQMRPYREQKDQLTPITGWKKNYLLPGYTSSTETVSHSWLTDICLYPIWFSVNSWGLSSPITPPITHLLFFFFLIVSPYFPFLPDAFGKNDPRHILRWRCVYMCERERDSHSLIMHHNAAIKKNQVEQCGKRIIWRQQHYESKTSGQQKHWRELYHYC